MRFGRVRARALNETGRALMDAGDLAGASQAFQKAIELDRDLDWAWFNLGLIYKYQRAWDEAARCNKEAAARLKSDKEEPAWWNLGIAATALRDWGTAREAWRRYGISLPPGEGPIEADFGPAPVRINPEESAEVVWCRRIDPARAVILNIPFPESKHRQGDIVLHDGVPNGERVLDGKPLAVFDVLERWEPSPTPTLRAQVLCSSEADSRALIAIFEESHIPAEDWNLNVRMLCEACSTGRVHASHEVHDGDGTWAEERVVGIAAEPATAEPLLQEWQSASPSTRSVQALELAF